MLIRNNSYNEQVFRGNGDGVNTTEAVVGSLQMTGPAAYHPPTWGEVEKV
jgi:hypothetical protein